MSHPNELSTFESLVGVTPSVALTCPEGEASSSSALGVPVLNPEQVLHFQGNSPSGISDAYSVYAKRFETAPIETLRLTCGKFGLPVNGHELIHNLVRHLRSRSKFLCIKTMELMQPPLCQGGCISCGVLHVCA